MLDSAEHLEVPFRDVGLGHWSEVQQRPLVGCRERLPGWNPRSIHALRNPLALEEKRHLASIGTAARRDLFPPARTRSGPRLYWLFRSIPQARGPVAQLGARLNRTQEVRGSNPLGSTNC